MNLNHLFMAIGSNTAEAEQKKSPTLSVLEGIDQQDSRTAQEGMQAVQTAATEVQEGVERLIGLKKPSEKISEKVAENKSSNLGGGMAKGDDDQTVVVTGGQQGTFPPQAIMVKKVVKAIRQEIKLEMKRAHELEKKLSTGHAKDYNDSIARIRTLKSVLQSALSATVEFLKELYSRYVVSNKKQGKVANV